MLPLAAPPLRRAGVQLTTLCGGVILDSTAIPTHPNAISWGPTILRHLICALAAVLFMTGAAFAQYPPPSPYPPSYPPAYPQPYPPPYPTPDQADDAKCRSWGLVPGTRAYSDCRITLDQNRPAPPPPYPYPNPPPPWRPGPPPIPNEISDRDAANYCEKAARTAPAYPIVKLAAKIVTPGREKVVKLSFNVIKAGAKPGFWNVECRFRGGKMTSFSRPR